MKWLVLCFDCFKVMTSDCHKSYRLLTLVCAFFSIYSDIPNDASYVSQFASDEPKYLTFEPDEGKKDESDWCVWLVDYL